MIMCLSLSLSPITTSAMAEECPQTAVISDSSGVVCDVTRDCWACEGITQHTCTDGSVYYECCHQLGEGSSFHHCAHVSPEDLVIWPVEPPPPPPTWWDEVTAEFSWPWWAGLRAATVVTFEHVDGPSWVTVDGAISGGTFADIHVEGGNANGSSGQDCAGADHDRCFTSLTAAWSNAYSNASGPSGFTLTSDDGSVRLTCSRGPVTVGGVTVPQAVHDCSTAWYSGAAWSSPTDCDGPQGADLGECVGYAYGQSH